MNYFERRRVLKETNTMDLVPLRIRGHDIEEEKVIVLVPKFEGRIYKWFAPSTEKLFFRIKLDSMGSAVWIVMDGTRNVQQICDTLVSDSMDAGEEIEEIEGRVSRFVMDLYSKELISFKQIL